MARQSWATRIARGIARGLSPSQAAGKPKPGERLASELSGRKLQGAAKEKHFQKQARQHGVTPPPPRPSVSWSAPTPGGTQDIITSDPQDVIAALQEIGGGDGQVSLYGRVIQTSPTRRARRRQGIGGRIDWISTGRRPARELLDVIRDAGGDVEGAIADYIADAHGSAVEEVILYQVKRFS